MTADEPGGGPPADGGGPLAGWRVLVPHAGEWGDRVCALLAEHGALATVVPLIEFETPHDVAPLDDAVGRLARGGYDWLVLTSSTAVLAVSSRASAALGGPSGAALADALTRAGGRTRVAAVGPGTARTLARVGVEVHLLPQGERSARGLVDEFPPPGAGAEPYATGRPDVGSGTGAVLYPRSDLADDTVRDGLAALGWRVDAPVAYRTVTGAATSIARGASTDPAALFGSQVRRDVAEGRFHAVLLSSGSTVRSLLEVVGSPPPTTVVACIGPRTERAAREAGLPVHVVSQEASAEGLVDALARYADLQGAR